MKLYLLYLESIDDYDNPFIDTILGIYDSQQNIDTYLAELSEATEESPKIIELNLNEGIQIYELWSVTEGEEPVLRKTLTNDKIQCKEYGGLKRFSVHNYKSPESAQEALAEYIKFNKKWN